MAFLTFRGSSTTPSTPGSTTANAAPLTNAQIDGNFASLNNSKLETTGGAISGDLTISGNLTVNGLTTTINSSTIAVDDKNIDLGAVSSIVGVTATLATGTAIVTVASTSGMIPGQALTKTAGTGAFGTTPVILSVDSATQFTASVNHATAGAITFTVGGATDTTANGGGITVIGATNKTLSWSSTSSAWESSEHISIATGKTYEINGSAVLSASAVLQNATAANLADASTTISLGNTATAGQTVNMFGASTATSTYKFAGGATANTFTKTVEIGLGGVAGSTTNVSIGAAAGTSTTTLNGTVKVAGLTTNAVVTTNGGTGQLGTTAPNALSFTSGTLSLAGNLSTTGAFAVSLSFPAANTYTFPIATSTLLATNGSGSSLTFGGTGVLSLGNNNFTVSTNAGTLAFGAASKTLTVNNSIALSGTDSTVMTFPATSTTVAGLSIAQTFSVKQTFATPSASVSGSINLPSGSGNTAVSGDLYNAGNALYFHNGTAAKTIAYIDSAITGSAATLTTARTLWGQSFNGGANVTGAMSSVGSITFATGADYIIDHADEAAQRNLTIGGQINTTVTSGVGGAVTIRGGESSATTTAATGGNVNIYGGITSSALAITKTTGSVFIDGGGSGASGTITYGSVLIGTQTNGTSVGTSAITIGKAGTALKIIGTGGASAGFFKSDASGNVSIDTTTYLTGTYYSGNVAISSTSSTTTTPTFGGLTVTGQGTNAISITSGSTGAVTLDSGTTGAVNIGTGASAKTITIGSSSSTAVQLPSAVTKIGQTSLTQGVAGNITLPATAGTLIGSGDAGTVTTAMLASSSSTTTGVTYAKMQYASAQYRVLGRITAASGVIEELTADNIITVINQGTTSINSARLTLPSGQTAGSTTAGYIQYNGTTKTAGQLDGGTTAPSNTTRLNYDGYLYATRFYGDGSQLTGIISGATLSTVAASTTYYIGLAPNTTGAWVDGRVDTSNLYYTSGNQTLYCTNYNTSSDIRLKDNVVTIDSALNTVNTLRGVEFTWKENGQKTYGVIAQEIEQVLPELVSEVDNKKSVNYNALIGFLIEAIKEQQKQIDELKSIIK